MPEQPRCQIVQLTPGGRGAIATLLVKGESVVELISQYFQPANERPLASFPLGRIAFGRWRADKHSTGEELIICRTKADVIEVHCHGGKAAVEAIVQSLLDAGCAKADWSDYTFASSPDAIAAEARVALAQTRTQRTASILLDQLDGVLRDALLAIEADLEASRLEEGLRGLVELQQHAHLGQHLVQPFRVVFSGLTNVGKSSLINAILGYGRAIVFDQPGTTRDVLTALTALDGWPVELIDTAGLRESQDDVERQGVQRAQQAVEAADLVVLVHDASQAWVKEEERWHDNLTRCLVVGNKCDLPIGEGVESHVELLVSATSGTNVAQLSSSISESLVPSPPAAGTAVPFTARQMDVINSAIEAARRSDVQAALLAVRSALDSSRA